MKVTLSWLKQYVEFDWSPDELAERLTMLGLEVEGVQKLGGEFAGIVVAQILTRDPVPGSDKLSVCKVNDGQGERTIICGAQNHKVGDKVALILPNFALPLKPGDKEPFVIKERKVFGITSQGMMCSPRELGLADEAEGLLLLREDARIGQPFAEYLGRAGSDVVYDLEITPNRPDLNSVIGIAREIAALTGNPLKFPDLPEGRATRVPVFKDESGTRVARPSEASVEHFVAVRIEEPELCGRYVARLVQGVKIGPSPDWLRAILEKIGVRSINNVVDVTNYVMLETGQPLHAFDYHLISRSSGRESAQIKSEPTHVGCYDKPTIVVRRALDGELFVTLDGQKRTLTRDMLLIADETKGIALAGVMGGQNTEIQDTTRDVLIESAWFNPANIRRTSKTLSLRTESSYRFERGADIGIADWASRRTVQLILETAGGALVPGVVDAYPKPIETKQITLRFHKTNELLGIEIPNDAQIKFLTSLGLAENSALRTPHSALLTIPAFRVDLKREADLIEEVARLYGVDRIPGTPPHGAIGANAFDAVYDQIAEARRLLTGLGLNESQGQTLVSSEECGMRNAESVLLANPLSSDMDQLRPSLLPGLIHSLRHNLSRKNHDVALFEIGRVFTLNRSADSHVRGNKPPSEPADKAVRAPHEERRVAIALTGQRAVTFWSGENRDAKFDLYDLKGVLEEFLDQFGLRGVTWAKQPDRTGLFLESAALALGGKLALGEMGQLLPALAKQHDLRDAVFLAELNLDQLLARRNTTRSFKSLPQFPAIRRDVAMIVAESVTHDAVLSAVRQAKPANLESVELFDIFRGRNVPVGQKSVAYAFSYRHAERTLTDAEVNAAHEKLVAQFKQSLQAVVREA